jgi:trans-aconitate methyltransferase
MSLSPTFNKPPTPTWDAKKYKSKHGFVAAYGTSLIDLLEIQPGQRILDLGCGTGELTHTIATYGADVLGIDSASTMLEEARANYPSVAFKLASGEEFVQEGQFDRVFSNAALHWMTQPEAVIHCTFRNLKPGGRWVFEMGGKNNVAGILQALFETLKEEGYEENTWKKVWFFPSPAHYSQLLEAAGFEVEALWYYDRPTPLADATTGIQDWLKMFATAFLEGVKHPDTITQKAQDKLISSHFDGNQWIADYKRLRVVAKRPLI